MTVKEIVDELKKSQGFMIFTAHVVKGEDGAPKLEFRYSRQQFSLEDGKEAFLQFKKMLVNDLSESGHNLLKSAERIIEDAQFTDSPDKPL